MRVIVTGAGVAGLAVARALARLGAEVTVLEAAPEVRDVGAGLQISPNGAAVLKALDLWEAVAAAGVRAEAVSLRRGGTGREVLRLDLGRLRPGRDWVFVHRQALVGVLRAGAEAAGVRIETGARVTGLGAGATVLAGGTARAADLVVGADGLHSVVRQALNGGVAPFFTMQAAWRAVIADGDSPPVAEVHMGPGRHLVSYPLGGGLRNLVAVEERRTWAAEEWSARDDPAAVRAAFAAFSPRVAGWLERVEEVGLWGLFRHPVARVWHRGGEVAILGDAAHPTLPFLAQGANLALEDAWGLAAAAMAEDRAAALAVWAGGRRPRVTRAVERANRNARAYHLRRPWSDIAHLGLRGIGLVAPGLMLRRLDWLYGHDVTAPG
jgi:salicylate hydroxylase